MSTHHFKRCLGMPPYRKPDGTAHFAKAKAARRAVSRAAAGSNRQPEERQYWNTAAVVCYIISSPPRSGEGFHNWLFRAARSLWKCGRHENDIREFLQNAAA